jgi:hypothetical protein
VSEIGDLIAILGEVDRALGDAEDPRRDDVKALVRPYRTSDEFRWYDAFLEAAETETARMPGLDEAMGNLAQPTRFPSMLPRRLLAVALAARVFPQFAPGGDNEDVSLFALTIPGIFPGRPLPTPPLAEPPDHPGLEDLRDRAHVLLEFLTDRDELPDVEHWHEFVVSHRDLISDQIASMGDLCSASVIERPGPGGAATIAVLETRLCIAGVSVGQLAGRFLQPASWPGCSQWWCSMTAAPAQPLQLGIDRYLEVVAVDCPSDLLKVAVFLDFATAVKAATRAVLVYRLSKNQSGSVGGVSANGGVDVDCGTIEVVEEGNHVRVATTKRVRFTGPLDTKAIAAIACWVGYGDNATDLIFNCAGGPAEAVGCRPDTRTAGEDHDVEVGSPLTAAVEGWVALARSCTDEAGTHARAVATRLDTGSYAPDTAASDAAKTGALVVRSWAKLAMQSLDAVRAITRPPRLADRMSRSFALAAPAPEDCELVLEQPLRSPFNDEIGAGDVGIVPPVLQLGEQTFRLAIDCAEVDGSYYSGIVVARTLTAPREVDSVPVHVIVP